MCVSKRAISSQPARSLPNSMWDCAYRLVDCMAQLVGPLATRCYVHVHLWAAVKNVSGRGACGHE